MTTAEACHMATGTDSVQLLQTALPPALQMLLTLSQTIFTSIGLFIVLLHVTLLINQWSRSRAGQAVKTLQKYGRPMLLIGGILFMIYNIDEYGLLGILPLSVVQMIKAFMTMFLMNVLFLYSYIVFNSLDVGGFSAKAKQGKTIAMGLGIFFSISMPVSRAITVFFTVPRFVFGLDRLNVALAIILILWYLIYTRRTIIKQLKQLQIPQDRVKEAVKHWNRQYFAVFLSLTFIMLIFLSGTLPFFFTDPFGTYHLVGENIPNLFRLIASGVAALAHFMVLTLVWEPIRCPCGPLSVEKRSNAEFSGTRASSTTSRLNEQFYEDDDAESEVRV